MGNHIGRRLSIRKSRPPSEEAYAIQMPTAPTLQFGSRVQALLLALRVVGSRGGATASGSSATPLQPFTLARAVALGDVHGLRGILSGGGASGGSLRSKVPLVVQVAAVPPTARVGGTLAFKAVAVGGGGSFAYSWSGLPPGLTSSNSANLTGSPTTAGNYTVEVSVTDASGNTQTATTNVTVTSLSDLFEVDASPLRNLISGNSSYDPKEPLTGVLAFDQAGGVLLSFLGGLNGTGLKSLGSGTGMHAVRSSSPNSGRTRFSIGGAGSGGGVFQHVVTWNFGDKTTGSGDTTTHAFGPGTYQPTVTISVTDPVTGKQYSKTFAFPGFIIGQWPTQLAIGANVNYVLTDRFGNPVQNCRVAVASYDCSFGKMTSLGVVKTAADGTTPDVNPNNGLGFVQARCCRNIDAGPPSGGTLTSSFGECVVLRLSPDLDRGFLLDKLKGGL